MHTKGPWKFYLERVTKHYIVHDDRDDSEIFEEIGMVYEKADARLIAAAPDLLEALENLLPDWLAACERLGYNPNDFDNYLKARAAIARAKGE